jgi:uncharacterized protein YqfA (UPF0365 family)
VLENPDRISKTVLARVSISNTAFEILSIDIADVDVGDNIGAKLQTEQARPTSALRRRKPKCAARPPWLSSRRCGQDPEMRAKVVEAEALVPRRWQTHFARVILA